MKGLRRQFIVSMVAGMLGALLVSAGPAAIAAIGDTIKIGQVNTGDARTEIEGSKDNALVKIENSGATNDNALALVSDGPNLRISNGKKVKKLNADRVDGFSANQLIRAAHAESNNIDDVNGVALTVTIDAPTGGIIITGANVGAAFVSTADTYTCQVDVDLLPIDGSIMASEVDWAGSGHTLNTDENCSTGGGIEVAAGSYTIDLTIGGLSDATLFSANLWAIFVPFDGDGGMVGSG